MTERLVDALRAKYPLLANRAKRHGKYAIQLFCLECIGGAKIEVERCQDEKCPLRPFRLEKE